MKRERAGIILCGGRSRRMGRPKAWLPVGDEVMLQRVARLLRQAVDRLIIVAAPEQTLPPLPPDVMIDRDPEEGQGPLRGLAIGLSAASRVGCPEAFLSACDTPLIRPDFVRRIFEKLDPTVAVCAPKIRGYVHPLAAVYRTELSALAEQLLLDGFRRPWDLIERVPHRLLGEMDLQDVDPDFLSLRNLNSPDDYEKLVREIVTIDA